jgi:hypothetical protein
MTRVSPNRIESDTDFSLPRLEGIGAGRFLVERRIGGGGLFAWDASVQVSYLNN